MSENPITPRLAEIEKRLNSAKPAPWPKEVWCSFDGPEWCAIGPIHVSPEDTEEDSEPGCIAEKLAQLDADFIAHAPGDIAYLLKRLKAATAALEYALTEIRAWQGEGEFEEGNPIKDMCDELKRGLGIDQTARQTLEQLK